MADKITTKLTVNYTKNMFKRLLDLHPKIANINRFLNVNQK